MSYIDLYVVPVIAAREAEYLEQARLSKTVWLEHGALSYTEARADDVPQGKLTSFPMAVKQEPGEVLYLGYATYRDRAHRDAVNAKVMADPRLSGMMTNSPANMQRLIYGGFGVEVHGGA
jgi:uncharacterized protein YbaA (DUF1428 family)